MISGSVTTCFYLDSYCEYYRRKIFYLFIYSVGNIFLIFAVTYIKYFFFIPYFLLWFSRYFFFVIPSFFPFFSFISLVCNTVFWCFYQFFSKFSSSIVFGSRFSCQFPFVLHFLITFSLYFIFSSILFRTSFSLTFALYFVFSSISLPLLFFM